jgi:Rrf2 family protein
MRLTRHADYAVRVMLDLASHPEDAVVPRSRISERQDLPPAYLAKIVQALARAGLVRTRAGAGGGISLNVAPHDVTLRRVIEAVEGPIQLNRCVVRPGACPRDRYCPVHPVWLRIQKLLTQELDAVTIAALVAPRARATMEERFLSC